MKVLNMLFLVLTILLAACSSTKACTMGNYDAVIIPDEKPSIFKPQEYQLQANLLPNVPKLPGNLEVPKIPGLPEIPKIPGLPEVPKIPGLPEVPKIPGLPEVPKIPELPEVPKIPGLPEVPKIPGLPKIPGISGLLTRRVCLMVRCLPRAARYQVCRCIKVRV